MREGGLVLGHGAPPLAAPFEGAGGDDVGFRAGRAGFGQRRAESGQGLVDGLPLVGRHEQTQDFAVQLNVGGRKTKARL